MGTIKVVNLTTYTDSAVLMRLAYYLNGDQKDALQGGLCLAKKENTYTFTEPEDKK